VARRARADEEDDDPVAGGAAGIVKRIALGVAIVLGAAVALYYPVGMIVLHTIDDNPRFEADPSLPSGSRAVAMAAALIAREVDTHAWVANDPFFMPGWLLDNMGNYQTGLVAGLARVIGEINDQVTRGRGPARPDPDLDRAAGLLRYPANVWIFDLGAAASQAAASQTASSDLQYRTARRALLAFNERLAARPAALERRPEALAALVERIAADLDAAAGRIEQHLEERSGNLIDLQADDLFYETKGRLYAYAMMLRELGKDFERAVAEREAGRLFAQALATLAVAGGLQPWVVMNGAPDSQFMPSHLAQQGFMVLRARNKLGELARLLRK